MQQRVPPQPWIQGCWWRPSDLLSKLLPALPDQATGEWNAIPTKQNKDYYRSFNSNSSFPNGLNLQAQ
jgi:hypothetical protein